MVITVRLSKEAAEMIRAQKRKAQTSEDAASLASVTPTSAPPPPSPSCHSQGGDRDNPSSPSSTTPILTSPISTPASSLPRTSPIHVKTWDLLPSSAPRRQFEPRPSNVPPPHLNLSRSPASFGDEDYGRLAGCIENMDSMESDDEEAAAPGSAAAATFARRGVDDAPDAPALSAVETGVAAAAASGGFERIGSNEFAVVCSRSPSRDDGKDDDDDAAPSSSQHHHPLPKPFLLDPKLGPNASFPSRGASYDWPLGTSLTKNVNGVNGPAYNTSPTSSLNWEECMLENLFQDIVSEIGHGRIGDAADHRDMRSIDMTPASSGARSYSLKRRSGEELLGGGSGGGGGSPFVEYGREYQRRRKNDYSNVDGSSKVSFGNFSFDHFATDAPIPSFEVFGSLPKSSTEVADPMHSMTTPPPPPLPLPAPPSFDDDSVADLLHPSMGTLEHYDGELYRKLRDALPAPVVALPCPLVPDDAKGTRLTVLRGSTRSRDDYEIEDCVASRAYAYNKFLREIQLAFEGCRYLLPGLQVDSDDLNGAREGVGVSDWGGNINVSSFGSFVLGHTPGMRRSEKSQLNAVDLAIARRRVHCAIYAFGGRVTCRRSSKTHKPRVKSIFRIRHDTSSGNPSSNKSVSRVGGVAGGGSSMKKNNELSHIDSIVGRQKYEDNLRQQYFEHGNRLSWDVQANLSLTLTSARTSEDDDITLKQSGSTLSDGNLQSLRKNRCKKCGQAKIGHVCPYASSLLRNIGIMVYPAANAHVAHEPGKLAPALCETNNFISIKSGSFELVADGRKMLIAAPTAIGDNNKSPCNELVNDISLFRRKTLLGSPMTCSPIEDKRSNAGERRKANADDRITNWLFRPKMEITPDQYRLVTPRDASAMSERDYTYPQVPLTFDQRKSMSNTLFSLSKLVPTLTDECALVLTEARKRDQWDLAVAELMTQVVCVLHCSPCKDYTLEGLRRYLLVLGVVC